EGPNAPGGRIAAFVFAGATRQSGFGSDAGLGRRWRRNRRGPNALNRDPCLASSGQIHLKLAIAVGSMDLAIHPAALHHYLNFVVKIVLPVGVVLHGELPYPPQ